MRHNDEIKEIKAELHELRQQFDSLSDALLGSQIIFRDRTLSYTFFYPQNFVGDVDTKLSMILDHLKLEFQWVNCKPHYEIKEREDK